MTVRLSTAVQHHPSRAHLLGRLLPELGDDVEVVVDPEPDAPWSPWRSYRLALERTPAGATHRLVVQDDAVPCRGFRDVVERVVAARPDAPVCLFVPGVQNGSAQRVLRAGGRGERWCVLNPQDFVPVVATVWPAALIPLLLDRVDRARLVPARLRSDDYLMGVATRALRQPVWATVPSLVEHPDDTPSLIGRDANGGRARRAIIPLDGLDPLLLDWTV